MSNTCIRVLADPVQIKQCREELEVLEIPMDKLAKLFNLAGNSARFKILYLLHKEVEMCPCDLSDILGMSVGGVSQHLRKLKDGGIIKDKKVGQTVFYSIVDNNAQIIRPVLEDLLKEKVEV